jgi:hypothetical protein
MRRLGLVLETFEATGVFKVFVAPNDVAIEPFEVLIPFERLRRQSPILIEWAWMRVNRAPWPIINERMPGRETVLA